MLSCHCSSIAACPALPFTLVQVYAFSGAVNLVLMLGLSCQYQVCCLGRSISVHWFGIKDQAAAQVSGAASLKDPKVKCAVIGVDWH